MDLELDHPFFVKPDAKVAGLMLSIGMPESFGRERGEGPESKGHVLKYHFLRSIVPSRVRSLEVQFSAVGMSWLSFLRYRVPLKKSPVFSRRFDTTTWTLFVALPITVVQDTHFKNGGFMSRARFFLVASIVLFAVNASADERVCKINSIGVYKDRIHIHCPVTGNLPMPNPWVFIATPAKPANTTFNAQFLELATFAFENNLKVRVGTHLDKNSGSWGCQPSNCAVLDSIEVLK